MKIHKYPRTNHLEGSRLQPGDEDLDSVPFAVLQGRSIVVEEKIDGANAGLRFDASGRLILQSRGHFLTGGVREKHFDLYKQWASAVGPRLGPVLGEHRALFGEWVYAKHTIYYDELPHFFLKFDILDLQRGTFLSTSARRLLLAGLPIVSVPILFEGQATTLDELISLVGRSRFKSSRWQENLMHETNQRGLDVEKALAETDPSDQMEGLYIKVEEDGQVVERYKWVRASFLSAVVDSGTHWLRRPIIPNRLGAGVDLFASES
jgi:hypothetical protein